MKTQLLTFLGVILVVYYLIYLTTFKFYWHDEVIVLLHLSGYSKQELIKSLYDGQPKTYQDLQKFQTVNNDQSGQDRITSVASLTPHKPPLYVILLSTWAKLFGNYELVFRSLSIVIYLLLIFFVYYLATILFQTPKIGVISCIFIGLSGRFMGAALDVWEYGLFAMVTVLSSFLFLKAFQSKKSLKWWLSYAISLVAGLYTHIFFILVGIAHLIYFLINNSLTSSRNKKYFAIVEICSVLLYLPWLKIMIDNNVVIYSWAKVRWSLGDFFQRWLFTVSGLFSGGEKLKYFEYFIAIICLFSLYYLVKKTEKKTWSFLLLLITITFVPLVIHDLLLGTRYSSVGRFYLPTLIAILFSISFLIGNNLTHKNKVIKIISYSILFTLISLNLYGKIPIEQKQIRFSGYGSTIPNAAFIITKAENPVVIGDDWWDMFPLSHKAQNDTDYILINNWSDLNIDNIERNYGDIFILKPSSSLKQELTEAEIELKATKNPTLWTIRK